MLNLRCRFIVAIAVLLSLTLLNGQDTARAADYTVPHADSIRRAIEDLRSMFGERYPEAQRYLDQLKQLEQQADTPERTARMAALQREALLENPLLADTRLLTVRHDKGQACTWNNNAYTNEELNKGLYSEVMLLDNLRAAEPQVTSLYRPTSNRTIVDVDLHYSGDRLLMNMPGVIEAIPGRSYTDATGTKNGESNNRWQLVELDLSHLSGSHVAESDTHAITAQRPGMPAIKSLTPSLDDIDCFDPCYMPDGRIMFTSNAVFQGLPCESGRKLMACIFRLDPTTDEIRQITFEQDSNWCPTPMNNGRIMYLRWEYSDTPHMFSRIMMSMNPDGTNQAELYGSGSYWPNSLYNARPIPGHPSQFVGIVTGHHSQRPGWMMVFDPARGRHEIEGLVRAIPTRDETVEPIIVDRLYNGHWPKTLHIQPLGTGPEDGAGRYFIVSAQLSKGAPWGLYLADSFDNMTPILVDPNYAYLEPVALEPREVPPLIPDRTDPSQTEATAFITDVYAGAGLKNIPRDTVKSLRLFTYHFAYQYSGHNDVVGIESGWDIKRILGTVPVEADGSAVFRFPANIPISIQPLDADGRALQLMRSWTVGMPGETVSCVGCHEKQNDITPSILTIASRRLPHEITPWRGPSRGLSFIRDVQPMLDEYCIGCHDGTKSDTDRAERPNFADFSLQTVIDGKNRDIGPFYQSYIALRPFVRSPGPESDIHMFRPMEYHASTSRLVQMLEKGHHGVQLSPEAWDRLITWIDLNSPSFGTWTEAHRHWANDVLLNWMRIDNEKQMETIRQQGELRQKYQKLYAGVDCDPESEAMDDLAIAETIAAFRAEHPPIMPEQKTRRMMKIPQFGEWPFNAELAVELQKQAISGLPNDSLVNQADDSLLLDLGDGVEMQLKRIPTGQFIMGSETGLDDEFPLSVVGIERPFWIGQTEVTNAQFAQFDPSHDSRYVDQQAKDHTSPGYPANNPNQPVTRVSWDRAIAFCDWLSEKSGKKVTLPTESQWEWSARAGSATPMWYGQPGDDFSGYENFADTNISKFRWGQGGVDYMPKVAEVNDGQMIMCDVGRYEPNPWGLHDMHGNVAEWTRSAYRPYPYSDTDGRNDLQAAERRTVRGGSWRDVPRWSTASHRLPFERYQSVPNVGLRVVIED